MSVQKNSVPDFACADFSIRISNPDLTREKLTEITKKTLRSLGVIEYSFSLGELQSPSNITPKNLLDLFSLAIKNSGFVVELADPALAGYNDVAMLSAAKNIPMLSFGPYGEGNHGPDEWVSLQSIENSVRVFKKFIESL